MATAEIKPNARRPEPAAELLAVNVQTWLQVKNAYQQCDDVVREVVDDMVAICEDPETSPDERQRALLTIVESLFPLFMADYMESHERYARSDGERAELAQEENAFASRVQEIMKERNLTQEQLGEKSGVGQSAISNMLSRQCRPQRRTIVRIAEALEVAPEALWPGYANK